VQRGHLDWVNKAYALFAEQNMLGNDIDAILLEYGVGDAGARHWRDFSCWCMYSSNHNESKTLELPIERDFYGRESVDAAKGHVGRTDSDQRMLAILSSPVDSDRYLASTWFLDAFKPQLEATLEKAFATVTRSEVHRLLGLNPGISVSVNGITRTQLLLAVDRASSDIGLLETTTFANLAIRSRTSVCSTCVKIDFSTKGNGTALVRGEYVKDQWQKNGVSITAKGGYSPNGNEARIFDTARLGVNGNPDLGSPNQKCGGPGKGSASGTRQER
jgi:hypothetical protein